MLTMTIVCARCTLANHASDRYCRDCGLPLGSLQPDIEAACDALEPYEAPEPADPDVARLVVELVKKTRHDANASGRGWQIVVPLRLDRKQAVYVGPAGTDTEAQRPLRGGALRHPCLARRRVLRRHRKPAG
jgi:hypothetical protein